MSGSYSRQVISLYRRPRNRGPLAGRTGSAEDFNPLCGDRIRVHVRLDSGRVVAASFEGDGCALAVASASVVTEMAVGGSPEEVLQISRTDIEDILEITVDPARRECVALPLDVLAAAIRDSK